MSIPIDNSTQLPQTTFTSGIPDFANVNDWSKIESNLYNTSLGNIGIGTTNPNGYKLNVNGSLNSSSLYQNGTQIDFSSYATNTALTNGLATKQNNLTALTNLLGMGSAITDIDYNKITLNKPTNFQADWNSTVINIPSTFPANMTNIYNKTEVNNISNSVLSLSSNFTSNTSNILNSFINTTNANLNNCLLKTGDTMTGNLTLPNLYLTNPTGATSSIYFTPTPSIYSLFSRKVPWAMYFAEDFNSSSPTILPNYLNNGTRDATISGTAVSKTTIAGNGATAPITFITGTTGSIITFPAGSIPDTFTILSLTRYTGGTRRRILQGQTKNWLHGHWGGAVSYRAVAFYEGWKTDLTSVGTIDDWLCFIGKNGGATPNNILADGATRGSVGGGAGNDSLRINAGAYAGESSDWALSCVMIWSTHLTDAEMVDLNTIINNYKNDGISIKSIFNSTNDDESIIESRVYSGTERTELLLFKGNDATGTNAPDRIRLKAANVAFDTYNTTTSGLNRNNENIVMLINENGNVGIGISTNLTNRLTINGVCSATTFSGSGASLTSIPYSSITGLPATFPADMTNIYTKTETNNLLNAKEAILTFSSPLTRTTNTIGLNQSLISYNNLADRPDLNLYLLKSGGDMTGNLTNTANIRGLNLTAGGTTFQLLIGPPSATTGASIQTIQQGTGYNQTLTLQNAGGTVGIGTTNANNILQVGNGGKLRISNGISDYSLIGTKDTDDGNNTRVVVSGNTRTISTGSIEYVSTATGNHVFYTTNSGTERMRIANNGNVGIGTADPKTLLNVNGKALFHNGSALAPVNGLYGNDGARLILWPGAADNVAYSLGIAGSTLWYAVPTGAVHAFYTGTTERLRIDTVGNVGIGITNPFAMLNIGTPSISGSDGTLVISKNSGGNRNFRFGYDAAFNFCMGDFGNGVSGNTWTSNQFNINYFTGNIGIGITGQTEKLYINGNTNINGSLSGGNNVCKRSSFTFTPTLVNVIGIGLRYTQTINLTNYMNSVNYGYGVQYTFRIHIWTSTGDYYDSINNVESIGFYVHLSRFGVDGKIRINTIYNNSNGSTIGFNSFDSIFYNGWNGTGGASTKVCVIENISSF
jgi:hypothetical protein